MLYIVLLLVLVALGLVVAALVTASSLWAWVSIGTSALAGVLLLVDRVRRRPRNSAGASVESRDTADGDRAAVGAGDRETEGAHADATESSEKSSSEKSEPPAAAGDGSDSAADGLADAASGGSGTGATDDVTAGAGESRESGRPTLVASAPEPDQERKVPAREPVAANGVDLLTDTAPRTALLASSGELAGADVDPPEEETSGDDALLVSQLEAEVLVVDEYPRYHLGHCAWLGTRATIPLAVKEARDLGFTPCGLCGPDAKLAASHRRRRVPRRNTA